MQITLIKLSGYREWTESLGSDREHIIQEIQGRLHSALSRAFSEKDAIAHPLRYDLMIAITNTLTVEDHMNILEKLQAYSPVPVIMAVAVERDAESAERKASELLRQQHNSHQVIVSGDVPDVSRICVVHADLAGSVKLLTKYSVYETYEYIMRLYSIFRSLMSKMGGIALYLGGDNMIGITIPERVEENIDLIRRFSRAYRLRVGIGIAAKPREAMRKATQALDRLRQERKLEIDVEC
ncbi:MAG: GTP cyclohydrolase IIa [Crenarchaeota archaeon]|nr:GTP cyclohydrolase IIa [Thermoproteota archaeon]